jgi:PAS domain S-box-containing protein
MAEVGLVLTSADGTILAWSAGAAAITRIAASAAIDRPIAAVLGADTLELTAIAGRSPPRIDHTLTQRDGRALAIALTVRATRSGGFAVRLEDRDGELAASELHAIQARYTRAIGGLSDGVWEWSVATGENYLSPRWELILGFEPGELSNLADTFFSRLHPDDVAPTRAALAAHLDERVPYDLEVRLRTRSGEYRWFRARGEAELDPGGAPHRMTGVMTDVHERKLAELEVQRMNADLERRVAQQTSELRRFMAVIEASTDFIGIADIEGRLLYLNRAFREALGPHPSGELWSTRVAGLYAPAVFERIEREARPAAIRDGHWLGETELRRFDGATIPVSQLLLAHVAPSGELEYFSTIMRDDTQRRRMAAELHLRAERLAAAAAAGKVGIWDWHIAAGELTWDAVMYALYGLERDQRAMAYDMWLAALHPDDRASIADLTQRAARGEVAYDTEFRVVWPDATVHTIRAHGVVHRDGSGSPVRMLGTNWDITDIKQAEAEIRALNEVLARRAAEVLESNQELDAFSYTVSHDLRAPLRAIEGFSRIVMEDFAAQVPVELAAYLGDIRRNTLRMGQLVDELLAFSRLGRQAISKRSVSVSVVVAQCIAELRARAGVRQIELRIGELPPCLADRALLKQVWLNLLDNAFKYTSKRDHAVIEIAGERISGEAIYSVKDNGIGFDMRHASKLFGVFQRLHRDEDYEGTGVGLAIVERMIRRHHGRVWADAVPDVGATFYFALPQADHDGAQP